jgi:hypothetical protein
VTFGAENQTFFPHSIRLHRSRSVTGIAGIFEREKGAIKKIAL